MSDVTEFDSMYRNQKTQARLYLWEDSNGWRWRILASDDFTTQRQECVGENDQFPSRSQAKSSAWRAIESMGGDRRHWEPKQETDRIRPLADRTDEAVKAGVKALSIFEDQGSGPAGSETASDYEFRAHYLADAMRMCLKVMAELEGGHRCVECVKAPCIPGAHPDQQNGL